MTHNVSRYKPTSQLSWRSAEDRAEWDRRAISTWLQSEAAKNKRDPNNVDGFLNPRQLAPEPVGEDKREYTVLNEGTQTSLPEPVMVMAYSDPTGVLHGDSVTLLKDSDGDGIIGVRDIADSMRELKELAHNPMSWSGRELAQKGFRPAIVHEGTHEMIELGIGQNAPDNQSFVKVGSASADKDGNPTLCFANDVGDIFEITKLLGFGEAIRLSVRPLTSPTTAEG